MVALGLADVINATNVFMTHLTRDPNFTMKTRQRGALRKQVIRQKLQRHRLAQFEIVGSINFTHPASSKQSDYPVTLAQNCTGHKPGIVD